MPQYSLRAINTVLPSDAQPALQTVHHIFCVDRARSRDSSDHQCVGYFPSSFQQVWFKAQISSLLTIFETFLFIFVCELVIPNPTRLHFTFRWETFCDMWVVQEEFLKVQAELKSENACKEVAAVLSPYLHHGLIVGDGWLSLPF